MGIEWISKRYRRVSNWYRMDIEGISNVVKWISNGYQRDIEGIEKGDIAIVHC